VSEAGSAGVILSEAKDLADIKGSWKSYEGTGIGKENLRQVQDHPPQRRGARDLRQHET
jgi:hypothetical protein